MMLIEEDLQMLVDAGAMRKTEAIRELTRVYRLWLAADAEGRVLPKLPEGWIVANLFGEKDAFRHEDGTRETAWFCELSKPLTREFLSNNYGVLTDESKDWPFAEFQFHGPTPAAAVAAAIAQIEE
jgi:hypothetical protein